LPAMAEKIYDFAPARKIRADLDAIKWKPLLEQRASEKHKKERVGITIITIFRFASFCDR
jgi:hypothetical protein